MSGAAGQSSQWKRLNEAVLEPGDIILVTSTSVKSRAIRLATWSDISHAMVYVDGHSVIDATGEGVQAGNTQRLFLEAGCPVHVLRLRSGISADQLRIVVRALRGHIGTRYSTAEAVLAPIGGTGEASRQQFCSRLVAQAFAAASIRLVGKPDFCTPNDFKTSPLLEMVPNGTVPVSAEEEVFWKSRDDVPQRMRDAINTFLDGARAYDKAVETFDDLNAFLVAHPERDENLCRLLHASGYLSIWQIERDKNPWQYDLDLMNQMPDEPLEAYCHSLLEDADGEPHRFIVNRGAYALLSRQHGLRLFEILANLYELLATLDRQRRNVAVRWLEARRLTVPQQPSPLTPHSEAWFAALAQWDPAKAAMTRTVLDQTGRVDVCSVCGDDPAADYRLAERQRPAGGVDTLRLCEDCLGIRRTGGENYLLLEAQAQAQADADENHR